LRLLLALAPVALTVALGGCGGDDDQDSGPDGTGLRWAEPPQLIRAATGGPDRVLVGEVENDSPKQLKLVAERVEVRDSRGRALRGDARFTTAYGHGLYGADVPAERLPPTERSRLGLTVFVEPGGTSPVFASFRDRRAVHPLRLDYGKGELEIPERITPGTGAPSTG
jgi:hypothetical protein